MHVYDAGGLEGTFLGYIRQELGPIGHCAFTLDATAAAKVYWQDDGNMINPVSLPIISDEPFDSGIGYEALDS